ncbi:MAG: hypothetical protein NC412_10295 [Roseburia sp.]|nr:hypothetical protein [Roseburia sp.]MCM1279798.1 hypothetical protein [Robinsoniella sp.]
MKLKGKLFTGFLAVALAVSCFIAQGTETKAAYTPVYNGDYDQYGFDKYGFDKYGIKYELGSNYNNAKTKMRIYADDASHLISGIKVTYNNKNLKLVSVKSNSGNLVAKIITNGSTTVSAETREYPDGRKETGATETNYENDAEIGLYAKKAGTYKVTITTKLPTGTTLKKTISIKASSTEPYTLSYAGATKKKDSNGQYYYTKFYSAKSGKLTVKAKKGYKISSIKFANSFDENGEFKFTSVKSGTKVKLNTKTNRVSKRVATNSYNTNTYKRVFTDTYTKSYDYIFPISCVKVTYKDTWLGNTFEDISYLYYRK